MSATKIIKAQEAITAIIQFPIAVNQIAEQVASISLGPWKIDVHCNYDDDCKSEHYYYHVHFSTKSIASALTNSENYSKTFFPKFQPVLSWVQVSLPKFSKTFGIASKKIMQVLSAVKANNKITASQQLTINEQLIVLKKGLTQSLNQLKQGDAGMANYVLQIEELNKIANQEKENLETRIQHELSKINLWTEGHHCGQSDAKSQYNTIQSEYTNTVQTFNTQFSLFNHLTTQLGNNVGILIGLVTDYIVQIVEISKDLEKIETIKLPVFLKKVDLLVAQNIWDTLENIASMNLEQNRVSFDIAISKFEK